MNNPYQIQSMFNGWTRVDMLVALYDRAIVSIRQAQEAKQSDDNIVFSEKFIEAQRCVLAIHSGLKPDESPIAHNIARLLHFVSTRLSEHEFEEAAYFLEKIRNSFDAIREEAAALERSGKIPSFELASGINEMA